MCSGLRENFTVRVAGKRKVLLIWLFSDVGRSTSFHRSHTHVFIAQEQIHRFLNILSLQIHWRTQINNLLIWKSREKGKKEISVWILGLQVVTTPTAAIPKSSTEASRVQQEVHKAVLGLIFTKMWFMGDRVWTFLGTVDAYNAESCLRKRSIKNTQRNQKYQGESLHERQKNYYWVKQRSCTQK